MHNFTSKFSGMSLFSKLLGGNKGGGADKARVFISRLTADLELTPDQVTRVEAALREFFAEKNQAKQSGNKADLQASKQDFKDDILKALSPEQQQKFMDNIRQYKQLLRR